VSESALRCLEAARCSPGIELIARVADTLGSRLALTLRPGTGPRIRDHLQSAMLEALLVGLHTRWQRHPEVPVYRPVRGVIDLVLDDPAPSVTVATEVHSDLRRVEQQVRWANLKAEALATARARDGPTPSVSKLLLLRSSERTRAAVASASEQLAAAYPARATEAVAALLGDHPWPGSAVVWCLVERGTARIMSAPPRGIRVGR
jgi:hypothetical protein